MNIKRTLSLLLMFIIVFCLVACDNDDTTSNADLSSNTTTESDSEKTTDKNVTQSTEEIESTQNDSNSETSNPSSSSKTNTSKNNITSITTSKNKPTSTNVTSNNAYKQATDSDNNVTVDGDGTVSITIPKWFLFKIEPDYNYKLTDKEVNEYKFKSVAKKSDGSATYKIGYNDYYRFLLISQTSVNSVVNKYKHNIWFTKIDVDAGYNNIKIYTKYTSLEDFDDDFEVYIALSGLQTTFYQYMNYNYSVGTTITVYNKDNTVLETYKFPDLLK
ncbi:MAG: hypothetical protein J6C29_04175 [Clostridia bacterium]|nr:hypothetical protein [Clostridia bacterium]